MNVSSLLEFLRRELAPTPGRGAATFRLTLSCVAATIPILTHHIPHGLIAMITIFLITKEDTSTTLLGSILALMGVTLGLGTALLALKISLDIPWLRLCFFAAFLFGGLFLKRILAIEGLGSAIGLPAALEMILPDVPVVPGIFSPSPEFLVEFVLWCWLCVFVGLSVNLGVQLLLGPDPLTLLEQELGARFRAVEEILRRLGGAPVPSSAAPTASLESLVTAGMSRQVELLKTASLTHAWARQRHEELAAIITLVDRLVTDAEALRTLAPPAGAAAQASLLRVADACARTRRAFGERRLPPPPAGMASAGAADPTSAALPPLADMERVLDEIAVVVRVRTAGRSADARLHLLVPDAFTNPEYVRFAIKGALSAMICYLLWVGFDYRGIYTSVITCFVVSLSTVGASNQKGLLRFGGAAVGGGMALISLVYLFPNAETIGGFWLVFGAGTAISAWGNFGSPRISYGGYQVGLAFFKGALHDFGPSRNLTVLRDRLMGVGLGLIVFGIIEHVLWPARAVDRMRERLGEMLRALAELARVCGGRGTIREGAVDAQRRLISQQVADVQGFIESTKFEIAPGSSDIARLTGDAQSVFLVLLAIARDDSGRAALPAHVREATERLGTSVASCLAAAADHLQGKGAPPLIDVAETLGAVERSIAEQTQLDAGSAEVWQGRRALYRELVAAVKRLAQAEPRQTAGLTNMPSSVRVRPCPSGRG
jgi:multidrug resistance protein MdtO